MNNFVSKTIDTYVNLYADTNPIWWVELGNGEKVYQDDGRPNVEPESAWLRLKNYCEENDLSIKAINVKNRSIQKSVCAEADGYTFCKVAGALMFGNHTSHSFLFGRLTDESFSVVKVNLPEFTIDRPEKRDVEQYKELLIRGTGKIEELQT